ncbi:MAG TPA: SUMF1/EgtB/PvdO family nonheme iron enzyme [Bryobacteraceae bacterium]|nr:SUMF1/EgtB/PvdO family nonheme iron enzyme [Bryobacteraceae bacterium]
MTARAALRTGLCCFLFTASMAQQSVPPARVALLILMGNYQNLTPLTSPHEDGILLQAALAKTNFSPTSFENYNFRTLRKEFGDFVARIKPGDQVLVYFSGYGLQSSGPDNFLLPVDFDPQSSAPLGNRALSLTAIQQELEDSKASLKIILLDASREEKRLSPRGLTTPDPSQSAETAILFSAELNRTVPNAPSGSSGLLAGLFSSLIEQPGSSLIPTLAKVQQEIQATTGGKPFLLPAVTQTFYFTAPLPTPPPAPTGDTAGRGKPIDTVTMVRQTNKTDRQEYVFLSGGMFQMGCVPSDRKQDRCENNEKPQHQVRISQDFWMGATEVTIDAYKRFVGANRSRKMPSSPFWKQDGAHPIVNVSWEDAEAFCGWVGGRLPTEAEWEYAARGGKTNEIYPFNSENSRDDANFEKTSGNDQYVYTAPVKQFNPNPWGLFDMAGNVWEWTADWFSDSYFAESPLKDPKGPPSGKAHVIRGGSFASDPAKHLRISYRDKCPGISTDRVGFRCILEDSPEIRKRFAFAR